MPLPEPLREKILRQKWSTDLTDICESAQRLVNHASPPLQSITQLIDQGKSCNEELSKVKEKYIEALSLPDETKAGQVVEYQNLINKNQALTTQWRALFLRLIEKSDEINRNNAAAAAGRGNQNAQAQPSINTKKPDRPTIDLESSESQWLFFLDEWSTYKHQSNLNGQPAETVVPELRSCCTLELRRALFDSIGSDRLSKITENDCLAEIKKAAVRGKNKAVHRSEFHSYDAGKEFRILLVNYQRSPSIVSSMSNVPTQIVKLKLVMR